MPMPPAIVVREQPFQRREEILLGSGPELHDHDARRRMCHKHIEQPVALAAHEVSAFAGDVEETAPASGVDRQLGSGH